MIDLSPLLEAAIALADSPGEERYDAFMEAAVAYDNPETEAEALILSGIVEQMTIEYYLEPTCKCDHEHEEA